MSTDGSLAESDSGLVSRLQSGELRAFEVLFERYSGRLLAYATGLLGDGTLAQDVVQETFLSLVKNVDKVDAGRGVSGWLFRTARNKAIDIMRRRKWLRLGVEYEEASRTAVGAGPDAAAGLMGKERAERVRVGLAELSGRQKEVLVLRFFGDLTFEEIARVTRRPLGTVLWQAQAGLRRLRELFSGLER